MRKLWAVLLILASCASPALADNLGSAAGGQAASQSGLSGCIYNSAPPTLTSGQQVAVQCDQNGNLKSAGGSSGSPYVVTPATGTCTDTVVTLAAATSATLHAATAGLKSLTYENIGLNPFTKTEGSGSAAVGNGMAISGAYSAGTQGGIYTYPTPPTNATQAISTSGTTVIVESCS